MDTIRSLVSFEGRWPGTSAEGHAADHLSRRLEELGREADVERTRIRPAYHLTHALHALLAVAGTVLSARIPVLGAGILLLVAISMFGDLTGRFYLLRLVMPRRVSQNVTSPGPRPDAPATVVLTAHYDAARSGLLFARRSKPPWRVTRLLARLAGPIDLVFWMVTLELLLAVLRLFVGDSAVLTVVQFVPTILLIGSIILFVDVALSEVVPGASDNASGVAALLRVAKSLAEEPPDHLDHWIVFTGGNEGLMLGMREWMRAHQRDLDSRRTFFINVDTVGRGRPRIVRAEGFLVLEQHDARLVELGRSLAGSESLHALRIGTDGVIPTMRGYSSITVCCTDEHGRLPNYHRHSDSPEQIETEAVERAAKLVEQLIRGIDRELVPAMLPSVASAQAAS
jgi:hypothetical protein